jgi:hypothetical protein
MFKLVHSYKHWYYFLFFYVIAAKSISAQTNPRQHLIMTSTFEGANYLAGWYNSQHCCSYSVQQTAEQIKAGSNALRFEVKSTDPPTSGSIRSEISLDGDPLNQERWYGFSVYLKDWVDDDAGETVFQWVPDNTSGSASMALLASGGTFTYATNNGGSNNLYTDLGPVTSNKWIDFVIRVKWATDTSGLLQLWMNGNLVINRSGVKTTSAVSYFKAGINKFGWSNQSSSVTQRVLYFDEVRVGNANATYNDVAPFLPRRDYFQGQ